jgi:prolyl 4-hydroxylase
MPPKKKEETTTTKSNGLAKKKISSPAASSSLSATSILVAVIAFALGVLSPPIRHVATQLTLSSSATSSSSADVVKAPQQSSSSKLRLPPHTPCTSSNLANYLHDTPIPGLHIVCIEALKFHSNDGEAIIHNNDDDDQQQQRRRLLGESNSLRFTFLTNSVKPKLYQRKKITASRSGVESIDWNEVKQLLVQELRLMPEGPWQQPWAIFTPLGERIVGENDVVSRGGGPNNSDDITSSSSNAHILQFLASSGMVLVFQGGNWRWPGVREGFQRSIELSPTLDFTDDDYSTEKRNITIETLSMTPLVVSIKGFLTEEECDHITKTAGPRMEYSGVSLKDVDKGKAASNWRTSQSAFISSGGDPILTAIDHRTASLSRVPKVHQEVLQVLRYGQHEKYDSHHDYFDPKDYQSDKNTLNLIQNGKKNRYATVFWYLTTVKEGGETIFPHFGNKPLPRGYRHSDCSSGLKVKPQKGKVIIFYSLDARGQMDPMSLHGACPVIGEDDVKYAANKWIWNAPMGFTPRD